MKNLKLVLIVTLLAFAAVSTTNADGFKSKTSKKIIKVTLLEANKVPGLAIAIYRQVDHSFLKGCIHHEYYTKDVDYNNTIYRVGDTYQMWVWFLLAGDFLIDSDKLEKEYRK